MLSNVNLLFTVVTGQNNNSLTASMIAKLLSTVLANSFFVKLAGFRVSVKAIA